MVANAGTSSASSGTEQAEAANKSFQETVMRKCMPWNNAWTPPDGPPPKVFFFDLGVETGQSTLVALGEQPSKACRFNVKHAVTSVPESQRLSECVRQTRKSRRILNDVQAMAAQQQLNFYQSAEVVMVEPSPAYSGVIEQIQKQYGARTKFFSKAITGFNETEGSFKYSLEHKTCDDEVVKIDEQNGGQVLTVEGLNLARLLTTHVRKKDFVVVKMDVEGSEYEILPCLAATNAPPLVDVFILEAHPRMDVAQNPGYKTNLHAAVKSLESKGVSVRDDWP